MKRAMIIDPTDNVIVMAEAAAKGDEVCYEVLGKKNSLTAATDVPVYHKMATVEIRKGERVIKYGNIIGLATEDIPKGAHVHVHNVESDQSEVRLGGGKA